jgi:hypothetical protein
MSPLTRAVVALGCVFAFGAGIGMVLQHHVFEAHGASSSGQRLHDATMGELRHRLHLDDEQVEQIDAMFAEHQETVHHIWSQMRPEVETAMQRVHAEIGELLRPDQRQLFHEWLMDQRELHLQQQLP